MPLENLLADDFVKNSPQQYLVTAVSSLLNQSASDFTINFTRPLDCSFGNWNVSLVDMVVWSTLYNVSDFYGNRTFRWSVPRDRTGNDNTPILLTGTLLAGVYNAPALIEAVQNIVYNYDYVGDPNIISTPWLATIEDRFAIAINTAQLTFDFLLGIGSTDLGWGFDPSAGGNSRLFRQFGAVQNAFYVSTGTATIVNPSGYTNIGIPGGVFTPNANQADVGNGISSWQVRCSLVGSSYQNGVASDVLFNFVPAVASGGAFAIQPAFPIKHQLNSKSVSSIRFAITDQNGTPLRLQEGTDFQNNATTIALLISRM